ncbi:LysR family transcriptional regulator [Pelagibacterium limicola]|uniref:LysR family transcriptional regulator n=1 Tax=Pelagibacterium limicola TaxID=2791022 RepID=UPI0018AFE957|nr:LysR family transcriptional regulator [Pelagibacterium limicola]
MYSSLLRQLDIKLLIAFQVIHSEGHLTRAAVRCGLTQSALSQSLGRLRVIFDDPLFVRTASGMAPTEKANALAPTIQDVLDRLGGIIAGERSFDPTKSDRTLRIGTYQFATITLAPHLLEIFQAQAPRAKIQFVHAGPIEAPGMLARGDLDLAIAPFREVAEGLHKTVLMTGDVVVVSRSDWTEKFGPLTEASYFAASHISLVNQGLQADPIEAHLDNTLQRRRIAISVPHYVTALHLASRSDLLATLPRKPAEWLGNQRRIAIHKAPIRLPPVKLSVVWHQRSTLDPFVQWVLQIVWNHREKLLEVPDE